MLLVDDLLMLPFSGFNFILRTLQRVAEEQYTDDAPVKERLLELQLKLEAEEISEKEYERQEAAIIRELREIENRRRHKTTSSIAFQRKRFREPSEKAPCSGRLRPTGRQLA